MGKPRKVTDTQNNLLNQLLPIFKARQDAGLTPLTFDELKERVDCKSFDMSFNALLRTGWVIRYIGNQFTYYTKL